MNVCQFPFAVAAADRTRPERLDGNTHITAAGVDEGLDVIDDALADIEPARFDDSELARLRGW
jgi:hypothetical protein